MTSRPWEVRKRELTGQGFKQEPGPELHPFKVKEVLARW